MSHYKSNLRDIEFNLFEVFGAQHRMGTGPYADMDVRHRARDPRARSSAWPPGRWPPRSSTPTATRPSTTRSPCTVTMPPAFKASYQALMDSGFWNLDLPDATSADPARLPSLRWAASELHARRQPGRVHVHVRPRLRRDPRPPRQRGPEEARPADDRPPVGRHDGAHRARRRLRRRRRPHQGDRAGRRLVAHRRREALHHLGRARHDRQHHPPRARAARGCARRHQGPVAVRRARSSTSTSRPASSASATASTRPTSRRRWASRSRRPASSPSARSSRPSAGSSATCTTASRRCSR